jgi:hypothetical protein
MVAKVNFYSSLDTWQDFCRQVVMLYTNVGKLEIIYLQKLESIFEASEDNVKTAKMADIRKELSPPGYTE